MSTTTDTPARTATPAGAEPAGRGRESRTAAVLALARFEARELLLQIPVLLFLALYVAYTGWEMFSGREGMDDFPVLQDVDRSTQSAPLLLAIAVFVCVNRAVLRSRRQSTDRHFDILPVEHWRRTVAHALSALPFAALTAVVVGFQYGWAALKPGAVGHGSPAELVVGPLLVLLAGVLGVLLARVIPVGFVAPPFVIGAFVLTTLVSAATQGKHWVRWLGPFVEDEGTDPFPSELLGRPAAWHALYLTGLTVLLLCLAVLVSGGRTRLVKAVTALALTATAVGVAGQSPDEPASLIAARTKVSVSPEKEQTCVRHGRSTYCAFPEWTGRTADWADAADRIQSRAGGAAGGQRLTVRQRVDARYGLQSDSAITPSSAPATVTVGTRWGGNRLPEFAVGVASVLITGNEEAAGGMCDARVVTTMWLALSTQPDPLQSLRDVRLDDSIRGSAVALTPTGAVSMSAQQTTVVRELLMKPHYSVAAKVKAHWTELTSAKTPTARVAELLGVPAGGEGTAADSGSGSCEE
ncbi:ABC transporter permease [Streptomyces sp. NPDC058751]|uniref:ABC transporter permease n=1 Tax=Streptomyces sp. NPDC058751 TaxID=3346623 RepID=UPI0036B02BF4